VPATARTCRNAMTEQGRRSQFESLLAHVRDWAARRSDVVSAVYMGGDPEGPAVVVLTRGPDYRTDFDDEVTELDIRLAEDYPDCCVDVLQFPEGDAESRIPYVAADDALLVYGG
jgi:hypothetical protein